MSYPIGISDAVACYILCNQGTLGRFSGQSTESMSGMYGLSGDYAVHHKCPDEIQYPKYGVDSPSGSICMPGGYSTSDIDVGYRHHY